MLKETLLRIPRKGSIRILFVVIVAFAGIKIGGALIEPPDGAAMRSGKAAVPALPKLDASLVAGHDLCLTCDRDTVNTGRDTLIVFNSLDTALQSFIVQLLKQYRPRYGAAVVMNPKSGRVLALVSYRHDSMPDIGSRLFLHCTFPAASVYKTITAAAAIETARYSAQTMIPVAGQNHTLYKAQIKKEITPWSRIPFEDAYANSINPAFARIGMYVVGKATLDEYNNRFGFNTAIPFELAVDSSTVSVPDDTTYAMAELASGYNRRTRISPLHGALIASAVAEDGAMPRPRLIDSISRANGTCLYRSQPAVWKTTMSGPTACELRTMMKRVIEAGTCRKTFRTFRCCAWSADLDFGGKTGSIEVDSLGKIDWFIGFAGSRDNPDQRLAIGIVTVHGRFWTVHSSYIGAEIFRRSLRPLPNGNSAEKQLARHGRTGSRAKG